MIRFKACPKCGGDVFLEQDILGSWHEDCLQCGYVRYLSTIVEVKQQRDPKNAATDSTVNLAATAS